MFFPLWVTITGQRLQYIGFPLYHTQIQHTMSWEKQQRAWGKLAENISWVSYDSFSPPLDNCHAAAVPWEGNTEPLIDLTQ
jgi:hypothetical protein